MHSTPATHPRATDARHAGAIVRHADTDEELRACWPVMRELRPHLESADDMIARMRRMQADGYRLLAVWHDGEAVALGGYRLQENLVYGRFLYLDDLVTRESARGRRWGERVIDETTRIARAAGCVRYVLDTGLSNALAQRFYFRQGLLSGAMRFSKPLADGGAR
ncbi:ribosomal protein S18 acetylase RimI-like enzyme [Variovorax sp. TBS-050B]|uniref:GNAT family N-acetyltransferase n=1 Tax=Variovorax sp. TBS-050B TaxID=2940551 RepID=UPI0024766117|nr:GNAT family N-acetyltransferase [Variovorax sp. TBS-050B]MDH6590378.1 ribosomal protein S18 acetylase RimI-like enzyme [Variovorax sp. TBS-050B]